jgi:HAD superfamily hydrolase (TIGR01509 family)
VPELQAVLFDLDGLLVDSEPLWTAAERDFALRHGTTWTPAMKAAIVGTHLSFSVPTMLALFGTPSARAADPDVEAGWLLRRVVAEFARGVELRPGAARLLTELRDAAVPAALVSSSYRILVDAALAAIHHDGSPEWFRVTVAGDEVDRPKPHPQPYLTAAAALGADPARCVVLEDSPAGVAAAEAAGCPVVAVPEVTPIPRAPGRHLVTTLADVTLDGLRRIVA